MSKFISNLSLNTFQMEVEYYPYQSSFGTCIIATIQGKVCWLSFENTLNSLFNAFPGTHFRQNPNWDLYQRIFTHQKVDICFNGTTFQRDVWFAVLKVPPGKTVTYGELAIMAGHPGAARGVGTALGANRIAYIIPCHRVTLKSGMIGQYRWGSEVKEAILKYEMTLV